MIAFLATAVEEGVKTVPDIIRAAAGSTLGIFALMIICLSSLSFAFFRKANQYVQLGIFLCLFAGVVVFGISVVREANQAPIPGPTVPAPGQESDLIDRMLRSSNPAEFRDLFDSKFASVNWTNLPNVFELDRQLWGKVQPLTVTAWDAKKNETDTNRLTDDQKATFHHFFQVIIVITSQIGKVLRMPRPPEAQIDLSNTYLYKGDWKDINLDEANLEGTCLDSMNLKNAELKGVKYFNMVQFKRTAWWEVKSINKDLLAYLAKQFPFDPQKHYGPNDEHLSQKDYDDAIGPLTSQF